MSAVVSIKKDALGNYPIKLHEKCVHCNEEATNIKRYKTKLGKQISKKKTINGEIRTYKFIEPELSIPYCKEHYEKDKKFKTLNTLLNISSYIVPLAFLASYMLLFWDFFNTNTTWAAIISIIPFAGTFFTMLWLKDAIMKKKNKYGIVLGILKFDFHPSNDSLLMEFANEEYAMQFISNNSNAKKY